MKIYEIFDNPEQWTIDINKNNFFRAVSYIEGRELDFRAELGIEDTHWEVVFFFNGRISPIGKQHNISGKIFSTVYGILMDFFRKRNPNGFVFTAGNDEESRIKLYKLLMQKFIKDTNNKYQLTISSVANDILFEITKKDAL